MLRWIIFILSIGYTTNGIDDIPVYPHCDAKLGMKDGRIPDSALSASSEYNSYLGPPMARAGLEKGAGAWCPMRTVSNRERDWIQIEFPELMRITAVETQGRYGKSRGEEYTDAYMIDYQRNGKRHWTRFKNYEGKSVIVGNDNTFTSVKRDIEPTIIAHRIRIIPYSLVERISCLRLELYGCTFSSDILYYEAPRGDKRGKFNFVDSFYDANKTFRSLIYPKKYNKGSRKIYRLSQGLGLLTDGIRGTTKYKKKALVNKSTRKKIYSYVGWKNNVLNGIKRDYIDIGIVLAKRNNVTSVVLHCNNMFTLNVRIFHTAHIYAMDRPAINSALRIPTDRKPDTVFSYIRDTLMETSRFIIMPLEQPEPIEALALRLYFDDTWILMSEIILKIEPIVEEIIPETKIIKPKTEDKYIAGSNGKKENKSQY